VTDGVAGEPARADMVYQECRDLAELAQKKFRAMYPEQ